jgi:hypothetical protein
MRKLGLVFLLALGTACGGDAVAPQNLLVGRFGGRGVDLISTGGSVRVQWVCNFARFAQSLIPAPDGSFSLSPTLVPLGNGQGSAAVTLHGIVTANVIDFEAVWLGPLGTVTRFQYSARENQSADFSDLACPAGE